MVLKTAGNGYTLKFIGRLANGDDFAQVFSDELSVAVGDPYRLAFQNYIGTAFGGSPFAANPIVGVVDRGGNVVDRVNTGTVSAALTTSPTGEETLRPASNLTAKISEGLAEFVGLYIREAGYPYRITFSTSLVSGSCVFCALSCLNDSRLIVSRMDCRPSNRRPLTWWWVGPQR